MSKPRGKSAGQPTINRCPVCGESLMVERSVTIVSSGATLKLHRDPGTGAPALLDIEDYGVDEDENTDQVTGLYCVDGHDEAEMVAAIIEQEAGDRPTPIPVAPGQVEMFKEVP